MNEQVGSGDGLLHWLVSGGDDRLDCDPASGVNMYGYGPLPRTDDLAFGSSTASTISAAAFAYLEAYYTNLKRALVNESPEDVYAREMGRTRAELMRLLGIADAPGLDAATPIMAASGTDVHLIAATMLAEDSDNGLVTITLTSSETGSGIRAASSGCHFANRASSGRKVAKGEVLNHGHTAFNATLTVRHKDGSLRADDEIERELQEAIEMSCDTGRHVLLVVADVSKTGLIAPNLETVYRLKARFGASLHVLLDACQFRVSAATIRAYLQQEFLVAITGSKFLAGPIFSGALICPPGLARHLRHRPLPPTLVDYCARADWPADWRARETLPDRANFGLLLRWIAALHELTQFTSLNEAGVIAVISAFSDAVTSRIEGDSAFQLINTRVIDRSCLWNGASSTRWDDLPSIFPFYLRSFNHRILTAEETAAVYKDLARIFSTRLGQPVACSEVNGRPVAALRICLSAQLIIEATANAKALQNLIRRAMAALDQTAYMAARFT